MPKKMLTPRVAMDRKKCDEKKTITLDSQMERERKRAEVRNAHADVRTEEAPRDLLLGAVVDRAPVLVCLM
jgi:hypothetical protein